MFMLVYKKINLTILTLNSILLFHIKQKHFNDNNNYIM